MPHGAVPRPSHPTRDAAIRVWHGPRVGRGQPQATRIARTGPSRTRASLPTAAQAAVDDAGDLAALRVAELRDLADRLERDLIASPRSRAGISESVSRRRPDPTNLRKSGTEDVTPSSRKAPRQEQRFLEPFPGREFNDTDHAGGASGPTIINRRDRRLATSVGSGIQCYHDLSLQRIMQ